MWDAAICSTRNDNTRRGHTGHDSATVLVAGEAGVGKSRLVHEVVEQTGTAGAHALVGSCVERDGGGIPFAPLVDMFRTLAPANDLVFRYGTNAPTVRVEGLTVAGL